MYVQIFTLLITMHDPYNLFAVEKLWNMYTNTYNAITYLKNWHIYKESLFTWNKKQKNWVMV